LVAACDVRELTETIKQKVGVIARNFWRIDESCDFSAIPWDVFIRILEHPVLVSAL
jgi:hypothetical protein